MIKPYLRSTLQKIGAILLLNLLEKEKLAKLEYKNLTFILHLYYIVISEKNEYYREKKLSFKLSH